MGSNCLAASASEAGRVWRDMHGSEAEQQLEDSWSPGLTTYPTPCASNNPPCFSICAQEIARQGDFKHLVSVKMDLKASLGDRMWCIMVWWGRETCWSVACISFQHSQSALPVWGNGSKANVRAVI